MNIIINQLQKNFGPKVAVDIENYSIQSGDMLGLVGNNGAGKNDPVPPDAGLAESRRRQCTYRKHRCEPE